LGCGQMQGEEQLRLLPCATTIATTTAIVTATACPIYNRPPSVDCSKRASSRPGCCAPDRAPGGHSECGRGGSRGCRPRCVHRLWENKARLRDQRRRQYKRGGIDHFAAPSVRRRGLVLVGNGCALGAFDHDSRVGLTAGATASVAIYAAHGFGTGRRRQRWRWRGHGSHSRCGSHRGHLLPPLQESGRW